MVLDSGFLSVLPCGRSIRDEYRWGAVIMSLCAMLMAASAAATGQMMTTGFAGQACRPVQDRYDVIIAGAGTGGFAAAIQAARLGSDVLLVESTDWIGGQLSAAGVTSMDEGYPPREHLRERGIYGEFWRRATAFYRSLGKSTDTCAVSEDHFAVEPHRARRILEEMIRDTRTTPRADGRPTVLDLVTEARIVAVARAGNRVTGVTVERLPEANVAERLEVGCEVLIDATEYGDVIPLTGAVYRLGIWRSDRSRPESDRIPPVQPLTWTASIRQYPQGTPSSLEITTPPEGYSPSMISGFLTPAGNLTHGFPWAWERFLKYRGMPDSTSPVSAHNGTGLPLTRTHVNFPPNDSRLSILDVEDPDRRERAEVAALIRTLGVLYYARHVMGETSWSVADDVGYDSPGNVRRMNSLISRHPALEPHRKLLHHFPPMPYVRESRRVVGTGTLTAKAIRRKAPFSPQHFPTSVAIGDYPVDVHGEHEDRDLQVELDLDDPEDLPERWIQWGYGPFQIPFECFIPETIDGFIPAEKNISQSRLASGATRLQPVTMLTGQAAGTIAALACRLDAAPRDVPPRLVQSTLLDAGSTLSPVRYNDVPHGTSLWKAVQLASLYELVPVDGSEFKPATKLKAGEIEKVQNRLLALGSQARNLEPLSTATNRGELVRAAVAALLVGAPAQASGEQDAAEAAAAPQKVHDLVIYGGTSAAVTAAVQATRMGKSVVVVSPDQHLGGLSSGGLGMTDTGNKAVIGGLAREFYHRIWLHYERPEAWQWQARHDYGNRGQGTPAIDGGARTMWVFEPHVAEQAFNDMIREHGIEVIRDEWLNREGGVVRSSHGIESITTLSGKTYRGRMFLDATYEGDLMAAAGVDYIVGREANSTYAEEHNGVQVGVLHHKHHFGTVPVPISPYRVPGHPESGVLPLVSAAPPGEFGAADDKVQAYCFRLCLTTDPRNRLTIPQPEGFDSARYELLLRVLQAGWWEMFEKFDPIPNGKTDCNNHGPVGFDNIGMNYDYPEASYERRREIVAEHRAYQQGLLWFLANDPRVPAEVQREIREWGLAKDEFVDNGNWPHQLYIREARRMRGTLVMTENHLRQKIPTPESIGMGSYTIDSHNVQRYITPEGAVQNEGDIGVRLKEPYQIAYGAIVPKRDQADNLLVPVACSASHIAYGSIRMEPVFMILGQSAATAACLAIDRGLAVQDVSYEVLRDRLRHDGQVLRKDDSPAIGQR
jgi:hypothetical protein